MVWPEEEREEGGGRRKEKTRKSRTGMKIRL